MNPDSEMLLFSYSLEKQQKKKTKMVKRLDHFAFDEKLMYLGLLHLGKR